MSPGVLLWTAHLVELAGGQAAMDWELAQVSVGEDDALAAAPIWQDRDRRLLLPPGTSPTPSEIRIGMYATLEALLEWLQDAPSNPRGLGRDLLEAMLQQLAFERDEDLRNEVLVYLRPFP